MTRYIALYNNDAALWSSYRDALRTYPNGGPVFQVTEDGSVANGYEVLARCQDKPAALAMLKRAGFRAVAGGFKA